MPAVKPKLTAIDGDKLEDGIGLCVSGGGYRAMLFHAGAVFRMNELGLLSKLDRECLGRFHDGGCAGHSLAEAEVQCQGRGDQLEF